MISAHCELLQAGDVGGLGRAELRSEPGVEDLRHGIQGAFRPIGDECRAALLQRSWSSGGSSQRSGWYGEWMTDEQSPAGIPGFGNRTLPRVWETGRGIPGEAADSGSRMNLG